MGRRVEREGDGIRVGNGGKRGEEENVEERERGRRSHGRRLDCKGNGVILLWIGLDWIGKV